MITILNYLSYRKRALRLTLLNLIRNPAERETRMAAAKAFVDSILTKYKVAVFSKTYCPYCTRAKNALASFNLGSEVYHVVELENRNDVHEIQDYLQSITGARSVPRVFINGVFYGGGDDTVAGKANGTLEKKLAEANAI